MNPTCIRIEDDQPLIVICRAGASVNWCAHPGDDAMPRGKIPRQPSKAGRQDKVRTTRTATKPMKITARKERPTTAKKVGPKPASLKGYNPIATERVNAILQRLDERYPAVKCALHHNSAWELLVATILSAQCTDARVNMVTPIIFKKYPTPAHFAALQPEE